MNDDMALVREYAASHSEQTFEALTSRYVHLVYSAALRQVGDSHLAEDVTQAVFIILARKAGSLHEKTILSGWLYRTTHYACADILKTQRRRQMREQEAQMQAATDSSQIDAAWEQLSPILDEAMTHLREKDRDAIVMRFFENKSLREVGAALGLEERAAQKRVARSLEKLRAFFNKRGVILTAAIIAGAVSANSVAAAPAGLTGAVTAAATPTATISTTTITLVKSTMKTLAWLKLKYTATILMAAVLAAGLATMALSQSDNGNKLTHQELAPDGDCVDNLRSIDAAKQTWALENHKTDADVPTWADLKPYLVPATNNDAILKCPSGGVYTLGAMSNKPTCSIPGHVLP